MHSSKLHIASWPLKISNRPGLCGSGAGCRNHAATLPVRFALFVASLVVVAGCAPGNPQGRLPISGEVTFNGEPLEIGNISFTAQESGGVRSGAIIRDGQYEIEKLKGLPPGEYLVRIHSAVDAGPPDEPPPPGPTQDRPGEDIIPARYNIDSELTIEVKPDEERPFNFTLTSDE